MSVLIIAEAGVNHNGSLEIACLLAKAAKEAGADCVKFQTFIAKNIVAKNAKKAEYQINDNEDNSQLSMLKSLELSFEDFVKLSEYCKGIGIQFVSTPFDLESIDFLNTLDMPFFKIPSGEITNYPYLSRIAKTNKPVIMSTGMSTIEEIEDALKVLRSNGAQDIKLLHCNTEYPTPYEDVNLLAMNELGKRFNVKVGYSDHTLGIEVPIGAVALGATVIEKHFTLDKNMEGPDHKASLNPSELKSMVDAIRNIERSLGSSEKKPSMSEQKNMVAARKSIVAKRDIKKGEILSEDNITVKRPGNGITPMRWEEVLGTSAVCDFEMDELIRLQ